MRRHLRKQFQLSARPRFVAVQKKRKKPYPKGDRAFVKAISDFP